MEKAVGCDGVLEKKKLGEGKRSGFLAGWTREHRGR
jgi:hypothetical protein